MKARRRPATAFRFSQPAALGTALSRAVAFLERANAEDARTNAEWLFSRVLNRSRPELRLRSNDPLSPEACRLLEIQIARLAAGEPLQYVQGESAFLDRIFAADPRALIPRPETELLAQCVLDCAALWEKKRPIIADVGAGGGCIAISLALERPTGIYHAIDMDSAALALARENALRLGTRARIEFTAGHLLECFPPASLDAVVSNPPYVRSATWERLPPHIREHEPRQALDGGPDGLAVIRPLVAQAAKALKPGGHLFLEIGHDQRAPVLRLLAKHGFRGAAVTRDFAGKHRIATARRPDGRGRNRRAPGRRLKPQA